MGAALKMSEAVFATAGQAVHVAFVIMSQPAQQDAPLRKALIRVMESIRLTDGNQRDWLEQLRGEPSNAVNFGGLDAYDVRAQCAMITQAVRTKLPKTEMWALQAKFGQTDVEDMEADSLEDRQLPCLLKARRQVVRRYAFSAERIDAIKGLSDWLVPSFPQIKPFAMDCMIGKIYANHKKIEISFRDLAKSFGGNHMTYARAFKSMHNRLRALEQVAIDRLEPHFFQQGVIEDYRDNI